MFVWVIYDISNDKTRRDVIKECMDMGLYRVQKSIFFGNIEEPDVKLLNLIFENITNLQEDSIYIFPMGKRELNNADFMGNSFKKDLVIDECSCVIF
ncbi:CRISPR-associated endonuclease Cas2 [Romboutsia maritimum]|uniref:CRISPR-associated endoribonuclease Cas2 n=1 Tax=Romboutsia maritimum TaxID=2020948 RepID=A0A371ITI3_9FIRM|nr:CRISPR-associated endonuclease Cas2 [Romboutsia maritimum]RDY23797.1 CRISPR-associated endonuclease Cas2 [Romboutsia maritimum]